MHIIFLFVLLFLMCPSFADKDVPHPVIDREVGHFRLPPDISAFSDNQLLTIKEEYLAHLQRYQRLENNEEGREQLFEALRAYDHERAKIVKVIPKLIDVYEVGRESADKMRAYAERFAQIHDEYDGQVRELSDYKSYDFRLGITYVSFMKMLEESPDLYRQLMRDINDEKSVIGEYVKHLDEASDAVENVSERIEEIHIIRELEAALERVEEELLARVTDN